MTAIDNIRRIQRLLEGWRELGHLELPNGVEFLGRLPGEDREWLHCVFPRRDLAAIDAVGERLGVELPRELRTFYRCCGGMTLFAGMFVLCGARHAGLVYGDDSYQPEDLIGLNHELDVFGWRPAGAVAFARNAWDGSVHVAGMGRHPKEIVRCEPQTGLVIERHEDLFTCVAARLYRLDQLYLRQ